MTNERTTVRLHISCGKTRREGWTDLRTDAANADELLAVMRGLPAARTEHILVEHFLEHLTHDDAVAFLRECRRVLREDGVLRLATPDLDWVWRTQYRYAKWADSSEAVRDCERANKVFLEKHRFLYNLPALTETLHNAGFATVAPQQHGMSAHEELRGLENEEHEDTEVPHLLIVEAEPTLPRCAANDPES